MKVKQTGRTAREKARGKARPLCLRLYVAGGAPNSELAIANATAICEKHFAGAHQLEIIDMLAQPARAIADGIVVTPTLVKVFPLPARKVIGNLSETSQVLIALGVS